MGTTGESSGSPPGSGGGSRVTAAAPVATYGSIEVGWRWEASRNLRMQIDMAIEKFGKNDITVLNENRDSTRIYAQTWFVFRL
jgi:hypothetical protein